MEKQQSRKHTETTIEKLVYRRDYFDCALMCGGAKVITTITPDGAIVTKEYTPGCRKAHSTKLAHCTIDEFTSLCQEIENCIATADRLDGYCDDSGEELKIYHKFGRIQVMDRGLGNEATHIGDIMHAFLDNHN